MAENAAKVQSEKYSSTWAMHRFFKDLYDKENRIRAYWLNNYKKRITNYDDDAPSRSAQILREKLMGGVPRPGRCFERVRDMKPADHRFRVAPDTTESRLQETIDRMGLFKDPTVLQSMYPVPQDIKNELYDGVSRNSQGRQRYLKIRSAFDPEVKFRLPPTSNTIYGFKLGDFVRPIDYAKSSHVRRCIVKDTFYSLNGVNGLQRRLLPEHRMTTCE